MAPEIPSSRSMAQRKELRNHAKGRATIRAMRSARARLMVLGTSSPNTTWIALRIAKESASARAWASRAACVPRACQRERKRFARWIGPGRRARGCSCNTHLDAGNDAVKIAERSSTTRARESLGHQLAHARETHRDKRELDGGEEAVERHQHENSNKPDQEHSCAEGPLRRIVAAGGEARLGRRAKRQRRRRRKLDCQWRSKTRGEARAADCARLVRSRRYLW